jgi:formylglycine-generating enzyme required for sulfatase activity
VPVRWSYAVLVCSVVISCDKPAPPGEQKPVAPRDAAIAVDAAAELPPAPTVVPGALGDCRTDYAPAPARDPNPMCKVAGGELTMGTADKDLPDRKLVAFQAETPAHRVAVSAYYLDQFEVTVGQVVFWLNQVGKNDCSSRDGSCVLLGPGATSPISRAGGRFVAKPGSERLPTEELSFEGAKAYCAWAGKRLPTEAEWEFAARHDPKTGKDLIYPWGDRFEPKRTNCKDADCADGFARLAPVGSFHGANGLGDDSSPWGVHDMAGNASELVADCWAEHYTPCKGACRDPQGPSAPCALRTLRHADWAGRAAGVRAAVRQEVDFASGARCAR